MEFGLLLHISSKENKKHEPNLAQNGHMSEVMVLGNRYAATFMEKRPKIWIVLKSLSNM